MTDRYTAVRILTGDDLTDASRSFCARYQANGTPTFLVLAPDGAVVFRRGGIGVETVADLLAFLVEAEQAYLRYRIEEERLRPADDVEGQRLLARFWSDHYQHELATPLLERLVDKVPRRRERVFLAWALECQRDVPAYRRVVRSLLEAHPTDPERIAWKKDLALAYEMERPIRNANRELEHARKIRILKNLLAQTDDPMDRAYVHCGLAMEYEAHKWFSKTAPQTEARMMAHQKEALKLRRLDPRRPRLLLGLGHAIDWSAVWDGFQPNMARGWLKAVARVDLDELSPGTRAALAEAEAAVRRRLEELPPKR